jgi:hypothetical protein
MNPLKSRAIALCAFTIGFSLICSLPIVSQVSAEISEGVAIAAISEPQQSAVAMQNWSFSVKGYAVEHQHMANTVNIAVKYSLKENQTAFKATNFTPLLNRITQFFAEYPNEDDYWEVVNRRLTEMILQEQPEMRSLTISLEVLPRATIPYTSISTVTATDQEPPIEVWQFSSVDIPMHHQRREKVNLSVQYRYKPRITNREYPDFVEIYDQIVNLLATYSHSADSWEVVNWKLATAILAENTNLMNVTVKLEATPTLDRPYPYSTTVSLAQKFNISADNQPLNSLPFRVKVGSWGSRSTKMPLESNSGFTPVSFPICICGLSVLPKTFWVSTSIK